MHMMTAFRWYQSFDATLRFARYPTLRRQRHACSQGQARGQYNYMDYGTAVDALASGSPMATYVKPFSRPEPGESTEAISFSYACQRAFSTK